MRKGISIGIIALFIVSAVSPMVIGYTSVMTEQKSTDEEYAYNRFNEHYYPEGYLSGQYPLEEIAVDVSSEEVIEYEERTVTEKKHQKPQPAVTTGGPMDSPWPMKCHDLRHTGRSQYSTADNPGYEKWRFRSEWYGTMESSAIIGENGIIYFGTMGSDRSLYALYPNGTKKWSYQVGATIWSTPAIAEDGTIYVTSYDAKLHALYSNNGTLKWTKSGGGSISSSPAIAEDGIIYFGAMGPGDKGRINAINPNGTEKWHYDTGYKIVSDPAVGDDGTIYIGSGDSYLYALYPNGTLCWRFKTGDWVKSHPSIAEDGTIYFDSFDDYFYALYPNGTLRWKLNLDGTGCGSAVIGDDGTIYFCGRKLHAILPNGTTKWNFDLGGGDAGHNSPAISADGTIYICTDEGKNLIAVNPDGTEKWRKQICNLRADSSPCIGEDGTIYVGSSWRDEVANRYYGFLHAFGPVESNSPPEIPTISGEVNGIIGEEYKYEVSVLDPDNNPVSFYIEWGDQTHTGWTIDRAPGEKCLYKHTWSEEGDYTIRVKAKDTLGAESDWAYLEVTMPRNKAFNFNFHLISWLLERFPIFQRLLDFLGNIMT